MKFLIISIIVISALGTLFHFLYDISSHNKIMGLFSAVNESTWEHIKIALTPTLLWSIVDGYLFGSNPNYFIAKFISILIIIVLIPVLFYGYKIFTKKDLFILNILIFYISIIASQYAFYYIINMNEINFIFRYLSCIGIFILFGGYMIHTLMPAKNLIFKDPITSKYGYKGHSDTIYVRKKH